jgi:ABC-2 type transport system ATP-binding protein
MAQDVVVRAEHLTKEYSRFWGRTRVRALDDLSLEIHQGETVGLMGPNGSGKTTTLKLLLGLAFPTRGRAVVLGHDATDVRTNARIGFLPEDAYFHPFLNADETLDFFGRLFGFRRAQRRRETDRLLALVGLTEDRHRSLREYSKGMARRIGIAQALLNDPELLFLDEPTAGLDPLGAADVKALLCDLKARGKTLVMCSHLLSDIEHLCDRIAVLDRGRLILEGQASVLLRVKDSVQMRARNVSESVRADLQSFLDERDVRVEEIGPATVTLERLFVEAIHGAGSGASGDA